MFHEHMDGSQSTHEPAATSQNRIHLYFNQLRGEIINILESDTVSRDAIRTLEGELGVYKRAYADLEAERYRFENLKLEAEKQKEDLENQLKGHRIVALLDGDGAIFNTQLIAQGQPGGHLAAQKLSESILQHLTASCGTNQYQLWVYVFLNKRGLMDTFGRVGHLQAKAKFEDFMMGFNQAADRFMMVDVGNTKEAADAKIKVLLDDDIKLPQTEKIIFGGCHDNGYATTLRSLITAGFKQKLILLPGYLEIAAGINELELPLINIPDLFIPYKLASTVSHLAPTSLPKDNDVPIASKATTFFEQTFDALPFASAEPEVPSLKSRPSLPSYSSAVLAQPKRAVTPDLDSGGSTTSSDESYDSSPRLRPSPTNSTSRPVNPNIPLSKHKPPPCTLFYLSSCKHGAECKYAHDYLLQPEHFSEIRVNAKKSPCPSRNKGEVCLWGDDCCYGHTCPQTTKCHFLKQGRCKFVGSDMHKEVRSQTPNMV